MPIYDQMMDLHKVQAQTAELQSQAYEQVQRGNMLEEQTKAIVTKEAVDQKTRDALQLLEQTRQKADAADEARARGDDQPKPMDPIDENIANAAKEYKKASADASAIAAAGGDVVEVNKMKLAALKSQETLYHSINAKVSQQQEQVKLLGQAAAAGLATVENADSSAPGELNIPGKLATQEAVRRMDGIVPGWSKSVTLDRDVRGDVTPGPKTTAAFQQTMKAGTARGDDLRDQQAKVRAQIDENRLVQDRINEKGRNDRSNTTAATAQANRLSQEQRAAASIEARKVLQKAKDDAAKAGHPNSDLPKVYKEPSKDERGILAAQVKSAIPDMSATNIALAADDYHHNVYDYRKAGLTRPEAEARAMDDVKAGFTKGSTKSSPGFLGTGLGADTTVTPQVYDRTKRSEAPMPKATVPPLPEPATVTDEEVSAAVDAGAGRAVKPAEGPPDIAAATEAGRAAQPMREIGRVNTLTDELKAEEAKPQSAERDRNITGIKKELASMAAKGVKALPPPTPELVKRIDAAGAKHTMKDGVIHFTDKANADKGIAMLPKGTTYYGPNGMPYLKKT